MNKQHARSRRAARTKAILKTGSRPRLVISRSGRHIYAQVVEAKPQGDRVIAQASTVDKSFEGAKQSNKTDAAFEVGKLVAKRAKENGVENVSFDRNGYQYHGRVKALATGAREEGLIF